MVIKVFIILFVTSFLSCSLETQTNAVNSKLENLYKEIPHYQNQPEY